jgi:hypothetical protein
LRDRRGMEVPGMVRVNAGVLPNGRSKDPRFDPFESLNTAEQRIVIEWLARHRPDVLAAVKQPHR